MPSSRSRIADASAVSHVYIPRFVGSGTVMRDLVAAFDWSSTSLGPLSRWSASLKTAAAIVLNSRQPMFLWWGPELIQIYNDACLPSFGDDKHSAALGQSGTRCWAENWSVFRPEIESVMSSGAASLFENRLIPVRRNGQLEDVFWTYTCTPVFDEHDAVAGVLVLCNETSQRMFEERRQQDLNSLAEGLAACNTEVDIMEAVHSDHTPSSSDIRFVAFDDGEHPQDGLPLISLRTRELGLHYDLTLTFGLNPQIPFDEHYRRFLEKCSVIIGSAMIEAVNRRAHELAAADHDLLLLNTPVGTAVLVGDDLTFQLANRAYCDIVGRQDIVGRAFDDVFPELIGSPVRTAFCKVYETGKAEISSEMPVRLNLDGRIQDRFYTYNLAPLRRSIGRIYGVMVIVVDITEQVLARQETERLNEELQLAARSKDEFLAMLGHELRNPLTPIVTALELMKLKYPAIVQEQVVIQRQVEHMVRLVDDLLDISKITRGKVELRPETVDLREMLLKAVDMAADLFERKHQHLSFDVPSIHWHGDSARMAQVVANLLTNAARYTHEGGRVALSASSTDSELVITVTDNGAGISEALLPEIFELFVQGRRSTDRAEGGLGIGLALVKNLVQLHRGEVHADSAGEGKGSTFTVRLPLEPPAHVEKVPAAANAVPSSTRLQHILVVDDNRDAVDVFADLLGMHGHQVTVAYDPVEALDIFSRQTFDVAILDIALPRMDGYDLAIHIRQLDVNERCTLIALSGYGQTQDKQRSRMAGFIEHLVKPVDSRSLLDLLDTL
ncbi:hybrid sensor histidine kinase/response regulator [Allohahella marinimesophila]|uniref:histidine kinase n=1 Tax=Allohahella marinimesophila TaxID=1054972 RepID=A0ABP7P246_9GAMM